MPDEFTGVTLSTDYIGKNILYYPEVASTMDTARKAAQDGAIEGTAVIADIQTSGRGRMKRTWKSPKGSIALSIVLTPKLEQLPQIIMVASLAMVGALYNIAGIKAKIKWPNDVLINGRKVCGILVENSLSGKKVNWTIVGIGININLDLSLISDEIAYATSISTEIGKDVSKSYVVKHVLESFEHYYDGMKNGEPICEQWRDLLETLGEEVQVTDGDVIEKGVAESVDTDGSLLLRKADGTLAKIVAGDVTLRK